MTQYPLNDCYTCVQGEGVQTGVAMVLLRLHGCEVGCPWCDTKETWAFAAQDEGVEISAVLGANARFVWKSAEILTTHITTHHPGPRWVLLTGGEPAQYNLKALVTALHDVGYLVALETSGTEVGHIGAGCDWVCVSPKIEMPGGKPILPEAMLSADEVKCVIGRKSHLTQIDSLLKTHPPHPTAQICLQPISQSPKATQLCLKTVMQRGWRLSLQTHKYLGIE